jgi:hypothetical protein
MNFSEIALSFRKVVFSFFGAMSLLAIAIATFFFGSYLLHYDAFTVLWGNFDFQYRKFPFDQKTIDFSFSHDIQEASVVKENFEVSPKIDGVWSLKDGHTLSFTFGEKPKVGDQIEFTLKSTLASSKWEILAKDYTYDVTIVSSPKIVKITPSGNIDNLSQNIAVFFNIPMVALSTLSHKDTLPCPLEIVPKLEGTCKWTTSSVLEFIPKNGFAGATKYILSFKNDPSLLYTLWETSPVEIITPDLSQIHENRFSVADGIPLNFNFPVDLQELQKHLEVYMFANGTIANDSYVTQELQDIITPIFTGSTLKEPVLWAPQKVDVTLVPNPDSQSGFFIQPKTGKWRHLTMYKVYVSAWLMPKFWNIALKEENTTYSLSFWFVQSVEVFRNIFSSTGALIDTRNFWVSPQIIPVKDVFFQLRFEQDITSLDTHNFSFESSTGSWKIEQIPFDVAYIKETMDTGTGTLENKKRIQLTLKWPLNPNTPSTPCFFTVFQALVYHSTLTFFEESGFAT